MATLTRLQVLAEEPADPAPPIPPTTPTSDGGVSTVEFILLLLRIFSQRSVQLAGHLLPLISLSMGFALLWKILPEPSAYQLAGFGLYATFSLAMILIRRK